MCEKREHNRIAIDINVYYRSPKLGNRTQDYLSGVAVNLSRRGLFIATNHTCSAGTAITIEFQIEDCVTPLRAKALVRWIRSRNKPRGMGLQISEFEGEGESELERWLTKHNE